MDEITALDIISIKREAAKLIRVNTEIREGQAIYIAAQKMFPKAVDKLKHTKVDCFYEDSRIDSFLLELQKLNNTKARARKLALIVGWSSSSS